MVKQLLTLLLTMIVLSSSALTLHSTAFKNDGFIPDKYAACVADGRGGKRYQHAVSPPLQWPGAPKITQAYVLLMADHSIPKLAETTGKTIPKTVPRETGYHWVLINIPVKYHHLPAGVGTSDIGQMQYGIEGINYFSRIGHAIVGGYGGPCPPLNDAVIHQYVFTLYAIDEPDLSLSANGGFTGRDVIKALRGHVLATAVLVGKYSVK